MVAKVPIRTVYDGSNAVGLGEFQTGEFITYNYGGTGLSTLGTAGQILKVNSGATALEWGNVEAVINIDGMTDGSGITLADADKFPISDSGIEKYILVSQISSYVDGKSGTLTNKTISGSSNTLSNIDNSSLTNSNFILTDDSSTTTTISLGETLKIAGGSGIDTSISGDTLTIALESTVVTETSSDTLTNKTISGVNNTISNINNSSLTNSSFTIVDDSSTTSTISLGESLKITGSGVSTSISGDTITISLSSSIDATKIANGNVSNTEFQYLDGVTSAIQTQLTAKAEKSFAIAQAIALG